MRRTVRCDGFGDALWRQAARRAGLVGSVIQIVHHLLHLDLQQHAMRQSQILITQFVDLCVRQRPQIFLVDFRVRVHAAKTATPWHPRRVRARAIL